MKPSHDMMKLAAKLYSHFLAILKRKWDESQPNSTVYKVRNFHH